MVQRLKHESDLQEARNNPVEEQLGGEDAFVEIDSLQAAAKAKDRELSRLQRELERVTSQARPLSTTPALAACPLSTTPALGPAPALAPVRALTPCPTPTPSPHPYTYPYACACRHLYPYPLARWMTTRPSTRWVLV